MMEHSSSIFWAMDGECFITELAARILLAHEVRKAETINFSSVLLKRYVVIDFGPANQIFISNLIAC